MDEKSFCACSWKAHQESIWDINPHAFSVIKKLFFKKKNKIL